MYKKRVLLLHILFAVYSLNGVFSKLVSGQPFLSLHFCLYYAIIISSLGAYAIGWQQIIKRLPLTTAFANKAVTVVWGMVWGSICFHEKVTIGKIFGAALVMLGVVIFACADGAERDG